MQKRAERTEISQISQTSVAAQVLLVQDAISIRDVFRHGLVELQVECRLKFINKIVVELAGLLQERFENRSRSIRVLLALSLLALR